MSGARSRTTLLFHQNPIEVDKGDTVTWINKDFDLHTVTLGSPSDEVRGNEFDSGYMNPQSTLE